MSPTRIAIVEDERPMRERFAALFGAEPDFHVVGAVATGREGLALIEREPLDVLLVDLGLPDMDGRTLIARCTQHQPECDVIVVTIFGNDDKVFGSLAAGATGYLLKDNLPGEIVECVRMLRAGGSPVSPSVARRLLQFFRTRAAGQGAPAPGISATATGARTSGSSATAAVRAAASAGSSSSPAASAPAQPASTSLSARPAPSPPARSPAAPEPLSPRETEILELVGKGLSIADIGALLSISAHTAGTHVKNIYRKLAVHSRTEAVYEARHLGLIRD
jgi:DNA-binding NarL/FixJ family response regulator